VEVEAVVVVVAEEAVAEEAMETVAEGAVEASVWSPGPGETSSATGPVTLCNRKGPEPRSTTARHSSSV
jgi:hypothetical protein